MTILVHELGQTLVRIAVISARAQSLRKFFEHWHFRLTTEYVPPEQKIKLNGAALPGEGLATWSSFNLGQRAGLDFRISSMGFALDTHVPNPSTLECVDSIWVLWDGDTEEWDKLFAMQLSSSQLAHIPCLLLGIETQELDRNSENQHSNCSFRARALTSYLSQHFRQIHIPGKGDEAFDSGLEWVLSL